MTASQHEQSAPGATVETAAGAAAAATVVDSVAEYPWGTRGPALATAATNPASVNLLWSLQKTASCAPMRVRGRVLAPVDLN